MRMLHEAKAKKIRLEILAMLDDYPHMKDAARNAMRGSSLSVLKNLRNNLHEIDHRKPVPKGKENQVKLSLEKAERLKQIAQPIPPKKTETRELELEMA